MRRELQLVLVVLFKTLSGSGGAACSEETLCVQSSVIELVHMQRRRISVAVVSGASRLR